MINFRDTQLEAEVREKDISNEVKNRVVFTKTKRNYFISMTTNKIAENHEMKSLLTKILNTLPIIRHLTMIQDHRLKGTLVTK